MEKEKISNLLAKCEAKKDKLPYAKRKFVEWVADALKEGLTFTHREIQRLEEIADG